MDGSLAAWQAQPLLYYSFLALFGAIAGSFASAAAYRIPRSPELTLLRPLRSHCGACRAQIAWHDNLPILSYLVLRGRCRACGVRYGAGYLVHEIGLAIFFVLAGRSWAAESGLLALTVVCIALTALWIAAAVDLKHYILPDGITLGGQLAAIPAVLLVPELHLWPGRAGLPWGVEILAPLGLDPAGPDWLLAAASGAVGCAAAWIGIYGIGWVFSRILQKDALGFGDVKYLAAVGAWTGIEGVLWSFLTGVFVGSFLGLGNILRLWIVVRQRRRGRGVRRRYLHPAHRTAWIGGHLIPFGPPLILGTTLVLLAPTSVHRFFLVTWPEWISGASPFASPTTTP
jgi:leader peptidase (prepilin peptidase)/N-methyltransferase